MPRKNTREAETEGISEQTRWRRVVWEGFLEKVAFGEGPKGGSGGERGVSPAGRGGEGQSA